MKGIVDMPVDEWRRQLDIILTGAFLFSKYAVKLMLEQGRHGSIINISSTAGHQGQPGNIGYSTGKSGILNFTRSAAAELGPHGIRVNSITPTGTDPTEAYERAVKWGRPADSVNKRGPYEAVRKLMPLLKQPLLDGETSEQPPRDGGEVSIMASTLPRQTNLPTVSPWDVTRFATFFRLIRGHLNTGCAHPK